MMPRKKKGKMGKRKYVLKNHMGIFIFPKGRLGNWGIS
jgi:hypothetical protein